MRNILTVGLFVMLGITILTNCGKLPEDRLMEKGKQYEAEEKFSEAIDSYEKLVRLYPQSMYAHEALYRAGLVYTNGLQDFETAIMALQRVIDEYPESKSAAPSQFMMGFIYANSAADTARARIAYNKFLKTYPDHELVPSVKWELQYLGKDINDIPELQKLEQPEQSKKIAAEE